ncbi:hypothetical protein HanXRQr2_Chr13g0611991 [Helianthus annuus]|uniref:Uncharacterized protein n=1 Tax=Helianthus annuus TaxID=4232 RepID=A0A9K3EKR1_HELAN|nr:hypothetical protein HanXRQr2_Chr13g0611991 [Helianthus annuus]
MYGNDQPILDIHEDASTLEACSNFRFHFRLEEDFEYSEFDLKQTPIDQLEWHLFVRM